LHSLIHNRTLLPRHHFPPFKKGESVTYVSGTICYLCVGSLIKDLNDTSGFPSTLMVSIL
jgi:hypothetical protein